VADEDDDVFEGGDEAEATAVVEADEDRPAGINGVPQVAQYYGGDRPPEAEHFAAILFKGGPEGTTREIQEEFDFWAYVTDPKVILKADDNRLLMADSAEELYRKLNDKFPAPPGCSFLLGGNHEICVNWDERKGRWGGPGRREYNRKTYRGWVVLKCPLVTEFVDRDQVRQLCVQYGPMLLCKDDTDAVKLREDGFSPVGGGHGLTKVRWNPQAVALRDWRAKAKSVEAMWVSEFDEGALRAFLKCFNPYYWRGFPFSDILGHEDKDPDKHTFWQYIKLARRLRAGARPWRKVAFESGGYRGNSANYVLALTNLLPFIRTVLKRGELFDKPIARFLFRDAQALKMVVPPIPQIPPKPFSRSRKLHPSAEAPLAHFPGECSGEIVSTVNPEARAA